MTMDPKLSRKLARNIDPERVIECTWDGRPAAVAFGQGMVVVAAAGFGKEVMAPDASSRIVDSSWLVRRLRCYGMEAELTFPDETVARELDTAMSERVVGHPPATHYRGSFPPESITTLPGIPGTRTVRSVGVVTELSATSGFVVTTKGSAALERAMDELWASAVDLGGNAIVGLTSSAFSATGAFNLGGDSVGILLIGTAVVVEPEEAAPTSST